MANVVFLKAQAFLFEFIPERFAAYGHPFTFRSIAQALGVHFAASKQAFVFPQHLLVLSKNGKMARRGMDWGVVLVQYTCWTRWTMA